MTTGLGTAEAEGDGPRERAAKAELLLLIDTCGADGSVALAEVLGAVTDRVLRSAATPGRSSSERLFPMLRELLASEGRRLEEVGAVAVVLGPGSFTGIRVGVAAAKGLVEALTIPVIGLSRLAVLASAARREQGAAGAGGDVVALLDAGRGEVFAGRFGEGEDRPRWERLLGREAVAGACAGARVVACEETVRELLPAVAMEVMAGLEAGDGLELAAGRLRRGSSDDVALLDGHYLRRTPAEVMLEAREGTAAENKHRADVGDRAAAPIA